MNLTAARATPGWMHDDELAWLATQARDARTILEVGCWQGRSTLALADNTVGRVFAVDHWCGTPDDPHLAEVAALGGPEGLYAAFVARMGSRIQEGRVVIVRLAADVAAATFGPASMDLVFLDGDHRVDGVRENLAAYRPLVKPGGILCGHDYHIREHWGVTEAVDAVFPQVQRHRSIWWVRL
jgi:predicted O-methyltransferase YrrM